MMKPPYMLACFQTEKRSSVFTQKTDAVIQKLIVAIETKKPKPKYWVTLPTYFFMILKRVLSVRMLDCCLSFISKREMNSGGDGRSRRMAPEMK